MTLVSSAETPKPEVSSVGYGEVQPPVPFLVKLSSVVDPARELCCPGDVESS